MLSRIRISDTLELPIKCDLYVLDMIQQKYGTVTDFEMKLAGLRQDGKEIVKCEPSANAVAFALPLMVMEGMDIEKEEKGITYDIATERELLNAVTRDFRIIAQELHAEMKRCFQVKK